MREKTTPTRKGITRFRATTVYPLVPGTPNARTKIQKHDLHSVGIKLDKRQAWQLIKGLAKFLTSRQTHVDVLGERGTNVIRVSSRVS